jgi:hypothetical protein
MTTTETMRWVLLGYLLLVVSLCIVVMRREALQATRPLWAEG